MSEPLTKGRCSVCSWPLFVHPQAVPCTPAPEVSIWRVRHSTFASMRLYFDNEADANASRNESQHRDHLVVERVTPAPTSADETSSIVPGTVASEAALTLLFRGARVDGDTVIVSAKSGNEGARALCGALLDLRNALATASTSNAAPAAPAGRRTASPAIWLSSEQVAGAATIMVQYLPFRFARGGKFDLEVHLPEQRAAEIDLSPAVAVPSPSTCSYPDCQCPFDAPSDPYWCARGLPRIGRTKAGHLYAHIPHEGKK